ncbi:MAG: Stk1 family PASTA domain-containing Ser/Thr kinase [Oscillospiraceae bacterium]|jgi:serine/threonine-protein kinase|nr:Stk1 family PASTA domain-containing Ser/Thr kinase [Oscillospiraceae bacterium]
MDNYIGVQLDGRYELLERIGAGGMADIYKADDIAETRTVAVKILKNEFAGSEDFLRRFRNESKAIALLSHPNIVKIFDVGFTESVQFIVMEYIDGITLTEYIENQGVLKWKEALGFVRQILRALQHAHDRGIVHRDIKSQNVMLLRDGTIKVMDFGIARFNREIDKTISEKAIGSVHYISPEQARGDVTDEKSDLYSVGVMLYEMLTGVKPFDGEDALAIALMHTNKTPKRPAEINASIPEGLEEITLRAMQKEPAKRYQTAGEMISDLREFEKNPDIIFEYKYFSTDGKTKFFDKVGNPVPPPPAPAAPIAVRPFRPPAATEGEPYDDEDGDDYDDDEVIERRSPLLPILFAVASVFVILTAWLIYAIVGSVVDDGGGELPPGVSDKMPMLVDMDYGVAVETYPWLMLNPESENSSEYAKGVIMWQELPEGRTIKANTIVGVKVSLGPSIVYVDDYLRSGPMHVDDVRRLIESQGLVPANKYDYSDKVEKEFVIKTDPGPGSKLEKGDKVTVWVSQGAFDDGWTSVPDLLGVSIHTARETAQKYRITLVETLEPSDNEMKGKIMEQSVDKNTRVENWTEVEVIVGEGEPDERESSIPLEITGSWSGDYEFKYYVDGVQVKAEIYDIGIKRNIEWEFADSGVKLYSIRIKCLATGLEGLYATFEIDFSTDPPTKTVKESNTKILRDITNPPAPEISSETDFETDAEPGDDDEAPGGE